MKNIVDLNTKRAQYMKKGLTFCFLILIVATGCQKDFLDITPDGRITLEDVFSDEKRTEAQLNTVYSRIPSYFWKYGFFDYLASYSDECYAYSGGTIPWAAGSLSASSNPIAHIPQERGKGANHYPTFWSGIREANVFLANIDGANISNEAKRSRLKSEAQLLRAFYYWELIKEFGAMPVVDSPFDNSFDYTSLTRPSFQESIDFIVKDCDEVLANSDMPFNITIEAERGRFSKSVAHAIKSQALLYNASPLWNPENDLKKWEDAATASKIALQELIAEGFSLAPDYGDYFLSKSTLGDKETIYEVHEPQIDPVFSIINGIPSKTGNFKVGATPTQELVDSYDMQATGEPAILGYNDEQHLDPIINPTSGYNELDPYKGRDPRFYATVWHNGAMYDNINGEVRPLETYQGGREQLLAAPLGWDFTRTGYYLRKFIDPRLQPGQPEDTRWKKYRLAEIYLNLAEAENESKGPTGDVYNAINTIRARVQMPALALGLSKEQMRDRIRRERRVELAIEEHRFWDVRRWKILDQTDKVATGMLIRPSTSGVSLSDGGFEDNSADWIYLPGASRTSTSSRTGDFSAEISGQSGGLAIQYIDVEPNTMYSVSGWVNITSGVGIIGALEYGGDPVGGFSASPGWTKVSTTFTTGPTNTTAIVGAQFDPGSTGFVDDLEVRRMTYTRIVTEERNSWQDKFLIFPIPIGEAAIIPDFNINQNPGW